MEQNNIRGQWAGSSHLAEKKEELLKAHEEFQRMLDNGYQIKEAKVKRPRIKKVKNPKQVVVSLGEGWTVKLSFEEYKQRGDGLKIIMRI